MNTSAIGKHAKKIFKKLDEKFQWSVLSLIGKSQIAKASILMPVVGYFIILNDNFYEYVKIDPRFSFLHSDSPWKLIFFYYGSLLLGIGTAAFSMQAPNTSKYLSAIEFYNQSRGFFEGHVGQRLLKAVVSSKRESTYRVEPLKRLYAIDQIMAAKGSTTLDDGEVAALCAFVWLRANRSKPVVRFVCGAFFSTGTILVAIPSIVTASEVFLYSLRLFSRV